MKCLAAIFALSVSIAPVSLFAKGEMVKIVVTGADLATPVEITDPKIRASTPWAGPGVTINGVKQTGGFIIDWAKRVAELPSGPQH